MSAYVNSPSRADHLLTNMAPNDPLLSLQSSHHCDFHDTHAYNRNKSTVSNVCLFCVLDSQEQMDPVGLALSSPLDSKERWERQHHQPGQLNSCKAWLAMSSSQVRAQQNKAVR